MRNMINKIALLVLMMTTALAMNGQIKITGTVVDEFNNPLEFATLRIQGTTLGVNTVRDKHSR